MQQHVLDDGIRTLAVLNDLVPAYLQKQTLRQGKLRLLCANSGQQAYLILSEL